jgi:hypothetical protein
MKVSVLLLGVILMVSAICGGGLRALGIEVPPIASRLRQVSLFLIGGAIVFVMLLTSRPPPDPPVPVPTPRNAASATHYYWNANRKSAPETKAAIEKWLNDNKPEPNTVSSAFSGDYDFYVVAKPGKYSGTYTVVTFLGGDKNNPVWLNTLEAMVDGGASKILGMSGNNIWVLHWDSQ